MVKRRPPRHTHGARVSPQQIFMKNETVPFHEANLDQLPVATLTNGAVIDLGEGRSVEVWRVTEEEGFCVRIFRPTNDGKVSKLVFGLKPPAAYALMGALSKHLHSFSMTNENPSHPGP